MRPEDAQIAWENEGQRGKAAMDLFTAGVEHRIAEAEANGLYMPAVVTMLRLIADELSDRFPSDVND